MPFKTFKARPSPWVAPKAWGLGGGQLFFLCALCSFFHLKGRQLSTFGITLEDMSGLPSKTSDEAVDQQCQKLIHQGALHAALELLMDAYGSSIYAFVCNMLRDPNTAADVLQTTFVQAYNNLLGFEKKFSFRIWLFTIAKNRAIDHLRAARRKAKISMRVDEMMDVSDSSPLADQLIHHQQMVQSLEQCLEEFRSQTKDSSSLLTLLLRFRENLSYEQMSKILGSSTVALRVRITRALPKLKRCMESKGRRL